MRKITPIKSYITEKEAVICWIACFYNQLYPSKRLFHKDVLIARFGCVSHRRLYEVLEGKKFLGSKERAFEIFKKLHPKLATRIDTSFHIPKFKREQIDSNQGDFFK